MGVADYLHTYANKRSAVYPVFMDHATQEEEKGEVKFALATCKRSANSWWARNCYFM